VSGLDDGGAPGEPALDGADARQVDDVREHLGGPTFFLLEEENETRNRSETVTRAAGQHFLAAP